MKRILIATTLFALAGGPAFAQSTTPSSTDPGSSQAQPGTSSPAQSPAQSAGQTQAQAQSAPATNQAQAATAPRIAPGSVIPVLLTKTIDAKKVKAGDPVEAKVTMDLKTNSGEVLVPKDTKVMGHVTEAQARNKEQKESQVGITFDRAELKGGDMPLPMSIQAVIAPPTNNANGGDQGARATANGSGTSPMGGGRTAPMGAGQSQPPASTPSGPTEGTDTSQQARPQITGKTEGVIGISNLKLEAGQNATQGSLLSSEKNNVKVESGTMLLLKVNQ